MSQKIRIRTSRVFKPKGMKVRKTPKRIKRK